MPTLIHTALFCEASPIISHFKLNANHDFLELENYKIYSNSDLVLSISGIGKKNTKKALNLIFKYFSIKKAINIGICGTGDKSLEIGTLFSVNNNCENAKDGIKGEMKKANLSTFPKPCIANEEDKRNLKTSLVDMEYKYFLEISQKHLDDKNIYGFKIISDYLESKILAKDFVSKLVKQSLNKWVEYV